MPRPPFSAEPPGDDPLSDEALRLRFEMSLLRAERTRATLLAGFFAVLAASLAARLVVAILGAPSVGAALRVVGLPLALRVVGLPLALVAALAGFEWLGRRFFSERIAAGEPPRPELWYFTTLVEMAALGAALYFSRRLSTGMATAGLEGPVVVLLVFIGLSATRLRFSVAAFTGLLAALCYLLLALTLAPAPADAAAMAGRVPERYLWVAGLIAGSGLVAGYVARQLRRQALGLVRSLAERQRLEREVAEAADEERHRIGRDLHDGLGSHLTGIAMLARALVRRIGKGEAVREGEMEDVAEGIEEGVEEARRLARGLSPVDLSDRDLSHALGELAARAEAATGLCCTLDVRGPVRTRTKALSRDAATHLYRIAQEALSNAVRHAAPTRIALTLAAEQERLFLTIEDDGRGLPAAVRSGGRRAEGLGLRTMRHRADLIGADFAVANTPGGGVRVQCALPARCHRTEGS